MSRNGHHRPPRPRIEFVSPTPSRPEAAAIASAIEQFIAETAPAPAAEAVQSPWQRAALADGVGARIAGAWDRRPPWAAG